MNEYVIIYGKVVEDKEEGMIFTYPYLGGESDSLQGAEDIAQALVNDKTKQAIVITHIFNRKKGECIDSILRRAKKKFRRMEEDMYECEEIYDKRRK